MVLESTVVCIDNGEFMRNGDFVPTRMQSQIEAANLIIQCKLRSNPENVVGVLSMAPKSNVQVGLTQDNSKLVAKLHQIAIKGFSEFAIGVKTAQLVLKLRRNRNHKTRIVVFVGSPVQESVEELVEIGKKLKKDKFQVDVISFGESQLNDVKLDTFVKAVNGSDVGSHLVAVPAGASLQEVLVESAVLRSEDGAAPPVTFGAQGGFDFGIDPNEDPELAMALRVSLEEQRQRQEQQARQADPQPAVQPPPQPPGIGQSGASVMDALSEEQQMELALRMSLMAADPQPGPVPVPESLQLAPAASSTDVIMTDPQALEELLNTLPGVDTTSEAFRRAKQRQEQTKRDDSPGPDEPKK